MLFVLALTLIAPTGLFGQSIPAKGTDNTFEVATWNIEWFGSANGPTNNELQFSNVLKIIRSADIDLWALQEIVNKSLFADLLDSLGTDYSGTLATYPQQQKTGFLYKTDLLSVNDVRHVLETFDDDFAGRPPLQLKATVATNPVREITFITIHMKAFSDSDSYEKRLQASGRLKNHVDFTSLGSENVIILGDFNDLLSGSITNNQTSPYSNFVSDSGGYLFPSSDLQSTGRSTYCGNNCSTGSAIDHILITNELFGAYIDASVDHYDELLSTVASYLNTTSDHLPVFASFQLNSGTGIQVPALTARSLDIYPNPAIDRFTIEISKPGFEVEARVFDLLGREVWGTRLATQGQSSLAIEVGLEGLVSGRYFVHVTTADEVIVQTVVLQ